MLLFLDVFALGVSGSSLDGVNGCIILTLDILPIGLYLVLLVVVVFSWRGYSDFDLQDDLDREALLMYN